MVGRIERVVGPVRSSESRAPESAVDGTWEDLVRRELPRSAETEAVLRYLRDGTHDVAPPPQAAATYTPQQVQGLADANAVSLFRRVVWPHLGSILRHIEAFPADARERLVGIVTGSGGWFPNAGSATTSSFLHAVLQHSAWGVIDLGPLTLASIESAGSCLGYTAEDMVATGFAPPPSWSRRSIGRFADLSPWVAAHADLIRPYLAGGSADTLPSWEIVVTTDAPTLAHFATELATAATANSKTLRQEVAPAVARLGFEALAPALRVVATGGSPAARARAVALLGDLVTDADRDDLVSWAREACASDRSAAVRDAVATLDAGGQERAGVGAAETGDVAVQLPTLDFGVAVSPEVVEQLRSAATASWHLEEGGPLDALVAAMEGRPWSRRWFLSSFLEPWLALDPQVIERLTTVHLARLVLAAWSPRSWATIIGRSGHPTPLELQVVAEHDGMSPDAVVAVVSWASDSDDEADLWEPAAIDAWARHDVERICRIVSGAEQADDVRLPALIRALRVLEPRPRPLDDALFAQALSGSKAGQAAARGAFGPEVAERVIPQLASSKVAERMAAASWLRELKAPQAEAALRSAIRQEKQDAAKAQLMGALEALGASLDEFLGPDKLLADATAALAKKNAIPKAIDWLAIDSLPEVRWADGSVVDPVIFRWFIAVAVKARTAEPSPLVRRLVASMDPDDVRRFGEALFESWVSEDLRPRPYAECEAIARQHVRQKISWANRSNTTDSYYAAYRGLSEDQAVALDLPGLLAEPAGSANDSKGLLAVVAATGGPDLAPRVHAYLKKWRGNRLAQGKAMLQMLAWTETPPAIQVVLTVGQRFRPRGLQQAAAEQAELLAARRGWTVEDLADRTVPRGGFDDDGRLVVDYGSRTFTALLRDDLTVELTNDETGKTIASLPAPRKDEDEAEVKAIQKELAAAKKEIKATAKLQPQRLYQAMCLQRTWTADDFERYIVAHPVMRRLAQRLVWTAGDLQFRPTADGALIDLDDEEVALAADALVTVAHDEVVSPEAAARWIGHLADYEVKPLFAQFDRPPLPPDLDARVVKDFEGHLISALSIRSLANKYGWQLGAAGDGGFISTVHKDFPGGNLQAVFDFTGMPATTEEWPVAWLSLYFARPAAWVSEQQARPLGDVPPILLREIYGEARAMAAAGTGFADDWKAQVNW